MTLAFTDVHYEDDHATAACVLAPSWSAAEPSACLTERVSPIAAYEPGAFYKRELPCLLAVLKKAGPVDCVVVDGYVWLDGAGTPGLGAKLYEALGAKVPVIGLAKTAFRGSEMALALPRPGTEKPLFLTAVGVTPELALSWAKELHGPYRLPTMIKRVDQLSREGR
ncbi:MAG: endonuclease V [Myxococcota bacterium]